MEPEAGDEHYQVEIGWSHFGKTPAALAVLLTEDAHH